MMDTSPWLSIRQASIQEQVDIMLLGQKLQLKLFHSTLIVDVNEDDFDRRSQSSEIYLERFNHDPTLVDGATSVNLAEREQLIATIVLTGLLKILVRNLACQT